MSVFSSILKTGAKVGLRAGVMLGKATLEGMFPDVYRAGNKVRNIYRELTGRKNIITELEALVAFTESSVLTNNLLEQSITLQKEQNVQLENLSRAIIGLGKSLNNLRQNNNPLDLPDLPDFRKTIKENKNKRIIGENEKELEKKTVQEAEHKAEQEAAKKAIQEAEHKAEQEALKKVEQSAVKKVESGLWDRFMAFVKKQAPKLFEEFWAKVGASQAVGLAGLLEKIGRAHV